MPVLPHKILRGVEVLLTGMSSGEIKAKSITEVFNEMEYEEKFEKCNLKDSEDTSSINFSYNVDNSSELSQTFKITSQPKSFESAIDVAVKTQKKWQSSSLLQKAHSLHKIWEDIREVSDSVSKLKNELSTLVDYFDFYSDLTIQAEEYKNWRAQGVVLVVLSNYSPYFVLGATVPAALATGCSVIVLASERTKTVPLFLQDIIVGAGLQEGLFNVVTEFNRNDILVSKQINKVFFCGSYLSAQKFYKGSSAKSFNFFCPNNTAALILESCDLNAAVDKIITETWGNNALFAVTNAVVQESIYNPFLEKLKDRVEQFIIENVNSSKFKDKNVSEKIKKISSEALKAGATVVKCTKYENKMEWSPTVIINYQDQRTDEDVPILKVLVCRTAKEGVTLVNNCQYGLGTSVWSEISSQALEVSYMLNSPNIWINCHGVFEAGVPLEPSGISGDCVLGGNDGILEYMSYTLDDAMKKDITGDFENPNDDKTSALQLAVSAQQAFNNWQNIKSRRKYLKDVANALEDSKELSKLSEILSNCAHLGTTFNFSQRNSTHDFVVIRRKIPVGVILMVVNTTYIDIKSLVSLITPAIALGNAVIVVLKEDNTTVKLLFKNFNNFLPKNILNVVVGINTGVHLASDPNIQAIWLYEESTVSTKFLQTIKHHSARSLKHIWVILGNISVSQQLFQKECMKNKVVWLTKVDQFP